MDFINPGILFGLAAAAIPFLLHFLNRSRSRNIPFSTLQFLKELQQQKIKRLKIKQLLLLLLRTLIILLLVLAFARPTLRGSLSGVTGSNAKSSVAIILDNSLSMGLEADGQTLFENARSGILGLANALPEGDEMYLIIAGDSAHSLRNSLLSRQALQEKLDAARITNAAADIPAALRQANAALSRSQNINREIYIFSDIQRYSFRDTVSIDPELSVYALPLHPATVQNASVSAIELLSALPVKSGIAEIRAEYSNTGDDVLQNTLSELFVDGHKAAQSVLDIPDGAATTSDFTFIPERSGFITGHVQLEQDDLDADNRRYFSMLVPGQLRTALVSQTPADARSLSLALRPGQAASRFYVASHTMSELAALNLTSTDVLVLVNPGSVAPGVVERIDTFVRNGGGLVLVLGENTSPASMRPLLSALELPAINSLFGGMGMENSTISLGFVDMQHPLFYGMFSEADAEFTRPEFTFAVLMERSHGIERIMDYSTGDPWLFTKSLDKGRMAVLTSGIGPNTTDLGRRTIFAPLMDRLVQYTGLKYTADSLSVQVGAELWMRLPVGRVNDVLEMARPDSTWDHVEPEITPAGPVIRYTQTQIPGIYKLTGNGETLIAWAVNPDPRESDLTVVNADSLQQRYQANMLAADTDFATFIRQNRYGTELWFWFALAALLLLIVEMILYKSSSNES